MMVDGPVVRQCFEVTRGPDIPKRPAPGLVVFETDHASAGAVKGPYSLFVSGYWPRETTTKSRLRKIKGVMQNAESVICVSRFLRSKIRRQFGVRNTRVLPGGLWGTDHVKFKVNPSRFQPKDDYSLRGEGPLIVMSISLAAEMKWRGIELFLEAAKDVLDMHGAKVVCRAIIHRRSDLVERWQRRYGMTVQPWRRSDVFGFTRGLGDLSWPRLLKRADVFVHPSTWDAWGCVVADAMFAGVPSLVFKGTGAAEISEYMTKVDPRDPLAIAGEVNRLLSMTAVEREDYGCALRAEAHVKTRQHRPDIARALQAIIEEVE